MKKVRENVWETNSSSSHVLVMTKNNTHINPARIVVDHTREDDIDYNDCVYLDSTGKWSLYDIDDGYGRYPFQILTSFEDKLKYAMCEFMGYLYEDDPEWQKWYDEFEAIAYEFVPGFKGFRISTKDIDIYLDKDGNEIPQKDLHYDSWNEETDSPEYYYIDENGNHQKAILDNENYLEMPNIGTIDHQSMGLLKNFLKYRHISLREFLTNKRYNIIIDGDEYNDWDRYKASGIINLDYITEEYGRSSEDKE